MTVDVFQCVMLEENDRESWKDAGPQRPKTPRGGS